jgi:RimJ/RimL family protein N-acetyltransferase
MLILQQATIHQLTVLLDADYLVKLNEFDLPQAEAIAPRFLLELAIQQLSQEPLNQFWRSPRLIVVDKRLVGMSGFKDLPTIDGEVEIGYGVVAAEQGRGFATEAVKLLLKEAFSVAEIQLVMAHTDPSNRASQRVLEKNGFSRMGCKVDPEDGEVWIWQRMRASK